MLGVADRVAAPLGGIDAGTASWTIGAEEDGPRVRMSMPHCQLNSDQVLRITVLAFAPVAGARAGGALWARAAGRAGGGGCGLRSG
jgi:hypothetical protein